LGAAVHKVPPHYEEPHTWHCIYQVGANQRQRLSLKVDESPSRDKRGYMERQSRNQRKSVANLGDEAYVFDSPAGHVSLAVRLGDTLLEFDLSGPASGCEDTIVRLAHQAVERLVAGEGIQAEAAPDVKLTGEWTAEHGDWRLPLTVTPDKALTLSAAVHQNMVLTTEAANWRVLDRARRAVDSGSYQWQGHDASRTTGGFNALWRRILEGQLPERIPPSFIVGSDVDSVESDASGPWPQMPLDRKLLGLWQGEGSVDQEKVNLLWRIRADGPSTLLRVMSGKVYVENVNRWQGVALKFSGELEKIGRRLKLDFYDGAVVTGFPDDDDMQMQMHDLKRLEWTRVGTSRLSPAAIPGSEQKPDTRQESDRIESPATATSTSGTDTSESITGSTSGRKPSDKKSVKHTAEDIGRMAADVVGDTAETIGGFIEGVFGGHSSSGGGKAGKPEPPGWELESSD
jgi:hypothetical protein